MSAASSSSQDGEVDFDLFGDFVCTPIGEADPKEDHGVAGAQAGSSGARGVEGSAAGGLGAPSVGAGGGGKLRASENQRKWCRACKDWSTDVSGTKALCRTHQKEVNAIDKMAAQKNQSQFWSQIKANDQHLYEFMVKWQRTVGPSKGKGVRRTGTWDWARYAASFYRRVGARESGGTEMLTETEFIARMVGKGRTAAWAQEEWERRRADPAWAKGTCEDTNLPTVAVRINQRREEYADEGMGETFEIGEKEVRAPKQKDIEGALKQMQERAPVPGKIAQAARSGDLVGAMAGLTGQLSASVTGAVTRSDLDFQNFVEEKGGAVAAPLTERTPEKKQESRNSSGDGASSVDESDKKKKFFSSDDEIPKYQARVRNLVQGRQTALQKAVAAAKEALVPVPEKGTETWERYADFATLLDIRVACGEALLQMGKQDWGRWVEERRTKYDAGVTAKALSLEDRLPCTIEVLSGLSPTGVVMAGVPTMFLECTGFDPCDLEIYEFESAWCNHMGTFITLLRKATCNVQSVTKTIAREASRHQKEAAKSSEERGRNAAKAAAERRQAEALKPAPVDTYTVFSHDWANMAEMSAAAAAGDGALPRHVAALSDVATMCAEAPCSLNMGVFKSACRKEFAAAPGTRKLNELTNADAVRERMLGMAKMSPTDRALDDVPELRRVTVFGLGSQAQHVGVEPFGTASVRAYASGSARLATVSFVSAQTFVAQKSPELKNVSLAKVRSFFRTCSASDWKSFQKNTDIQVANVLAPCLVYIPAGWLVLEKPSKEDVYGISVSVVAPRASPTFLELVRLSDNMVAPQSGPAKTQLSIMRRIRDETSKKVEVSGGGAEGTEKTVAAETASEADNKLADEVGGGQKRVAEGGGNGGSGDVGEGGDGDVSPPTPKPKRARS